MRIAPLPLRRSMSLVTTSAFTLPDIVIAVFRSYCRAAGSWTLWTYLATLALHASANTPLLRLAHEHRRVV